METRKTKFLSVFSGCKNTIIVLKEESVIFGLSKRALMIKNIQVLRGIAALMVVYFHAVGALYSYGLIEDLASHSLIYAWGAYGVDIFFVISGFIMVVSVSRKKISPEQFLKHRLLRVVPLYWLFTGIYVLLYFAVPALFKQRILMPDQILGSFFFYEYLVNQREPALLLGWTLEFEMLFYLIFTLGLFLKTWKRTILLTSSILLILISVGLENIAFEFVIGMSIGAWYLNRERKAQPLYLILPLFAIGTFFLILGTFYMTDTRIPQIIGAGIIVFTILITKEWKSKLALTLGNASYSIYLIQLFSIPLFFKVYSALQLPKTELALPFIVFSVLAFTSICGYFSYLLIEKPFLKRGKKLI